MAANMQHMMMPQAQQQQLRQQALMSLRQIVYTSMNNHPPQPHGWQASYPVADRVTRATNLYVFSIRRGVVAQIGKEAFAPLKANPCLE